MVFADRLRFSVFLFLVSAFHFSYSFRLFVPIVHSDSPMKKFRHEFRIHARGNGAVGESESLRFFRSFSAACGCSGSGCTKLVDKTARSFLNFLADCLPGIAAEANGLLRSRRHIENDAKQNEVGKRGRSAVGNERQGNAGNRNKAGRSCPDSGSADTAAWQSRQS